jgi:hypothetical protein
MNVPFYSNAKNSVDKDTKWKNTKYKFTSDNSRNSDSSEQSPSPSHFNYNNIQMPILNLFDRPISTTQLGDNGVLPSVIETFEDEVEGPPQLETETEIGAETELENQTNNLNINTMTDTLYKWVNPLTDMRFPNVLDNDTNMIGINSKETKIDYANEDGLTADYYAQTHSRNILERDNPVPIPTPNVEADPETPVEENEPDPTAPSEKTKGKSKNAGSSSTDERSANHKKYDVIRLFSNFLADQSRKNAKLLAIAIIENIPELFFVPEIISTAIVRAATPKNKRKGADYAQNKFKLKTHFKSFLVILICLYITFNWWYLMLYTDHYIDLYSILKSPFIIPLIWIIGPVMAPFAKLNYYLLGRRLEQDYYTKNIEPMLRKKAIYLTLLLLIVITLYDRIMLMFTTNMRSLIDNKNESQMLFMMVAGVAATTFMYSVVFDEEKNSKFINKVSFSLSILFYIIMFIVIMILCKGISGIILIYLLFYSFLFLLAWEGLNTPNKIIEMIVDTTEVCVKDTESKFGKLKGLFYKYSFLIFIFSILVIRLIAAVLDARTITEKNVRVSCYALYTALGLGLLVFTGISFWRVFQNVHSIVVTPEPKPPEPTNAPPASAETKPVEELEEAETPFSKLMNRFLSFLWVVLELFLFGFDTVKYLFFRLQYFFIAIIILVIFISIIVSLIQAS